MREVWEWYEEYGGGGYAVTLCHPARWQLVIKSQLARTSHLVGIEANIHQGGHQLDAIKLSGVDGLNERRPTGCDIGLGAPSK